MEREYLGYGREYLGYETHGTDHEYLGYLDPWYGCRQSGLEIASLGYNHYDLRNLVHPKPWREPPGCNVLNSWWSLRNLVYQIRGRNPRH
jgi:hypothetical protein